MANIIIQDTRPSAVIAQSAIDMILGGEIDAVQAWAELTRMADAIEQVKANKQVLDVVLTEVAKYGKAGAKCAGYTLTQVESGVRYDYANCNDSTLAELEADKKALDAAIKERQTMLKAIPTSGMADVTTGEVLYPPVKLSKTTIKATKNKDGYDK